MQLNSGQQSAVDRVLYELFETESQASKGFTIIGEGGTGKTFSVTEIVREVVDNGHNVLFTAPTHKAVKQLQKSCKQNGLISDRISFSTIHSALGLALMPTDENKYVNRVKDSIIGKFAVVVLDEGSMAPKVLMEDYLLPDLYASNAFLLIMGDDMQLPPVKEDFSVAFTLFPTAELTENQRQQNNPDGSPNGILQLARALRPCIKNKTAFKFDASRYQHNLVSMMDKDFLRSVIDFYGPDTDMEQTRVLAWRNARVNDINKAVRKKVYGPDADRFEVGERLITTGFIKDVNGDIVLTSDEECILTAQKESTVVDKHTNDIWKTRLLTLAPCYADVKQVFAHVIHEDEMERYNRQVSKLKETALNKTGSERGFAWRKFHEFQEMFSGISYCYCTTVHRSQGSTYQTVFVDVKDILDCPRPTERRKLLYVAFSRPRETLLINKTTFNA